MTCRVRILQWIVNTIRIPVEIMWIGRIGHKGIRADEPAYCGVIEACAVVVEPGVVEALAGELLVGVNCAARCPGLAVGIVLDAPHLFAICVGNHGGAREVVLVNETQFCAILQRHSAILGAMVRGNDNHSQVSLAAEACSIKCLVYAVFTGVIQKVEDAASLVLSVLAVK